MKNLSPLNLFDFFASIRGKTLLLFLSLSLIPLLAAGSLTGWRGRQIMEERITNELERVTKRRAARINRVLQGSIKDAQMIAALEEVRSMNSRHVHRTIRTFGSQWERYVSIKVLTVQGQVLAESNHTPEITRSADGFRVAVPHSILGGMNPGEVSLIRPSPPWEDEGPVLVAAAPIMGENALPAGAVALCMSTRELSTLLSDMRVGQTGEAYLIDREGFFITPSRFGAELRREGQVKGPSEPGQRADTLAVREVLAGRSGLSTYRNYRGKLVIGTYAPIPLKGWGLISEQEIDEVYAPITHLSTLMLFMGLGFAVLAVFAAAVSARRITGRIIALTLAAEALEQGDLDSRVVVLDTDEVGRMARSFNSMAERIQTLVCDLKKQIEAAQESEARYRGLFDGVPVGLYRTTSSGRFLDVNPAMMQMTGYAGRELMLATHSAQLYPNPEDREKWKEQVDREGTVHGFEVQLRRNDGGLIWVADTARVFKDDNGQVLFYEGSIQNITERKRAEEELERHRRHLEELVEQRTAELKESYTRLEEANRRIMDSIEYARTIQLAILPKLEDVIRHMSDCFVIWKPKDLIGGDFFWFSEYEEGFLIAVIDCTGHGVSGAVMTMIAATTLDRVVHEVGHDDPARILGELNVQVQRILHRRSSRAHSGEGMDIGLCHVDASRSVLTYAGSRISLFHGKGGGAIEEIKGDQQSIGNRSSETGFKYTNHRVPLEGAGVFTMSSDGFMDQIGGSKKLPFGKRRLRSILTDCHDEPLRRQKEILLEAFEEHRGEEEQRDDILVVGFRMGSSKERGRQEPRGNDVGTV